MKWIRKGIVIYMIVFGAMVAFDGYFFNSTNGDFPLSNTVAFGAFITVVVFILFFSPPKFKRRKAFVSVLDTAKRVPRKKKK
jgi:hypothetical protein